VEVEQDEEGDSLAISSFAALLPALPSEPVPTSTSTSNVPVPSVSSGATNAIPDDPFIEVSVDNFMDFPGAYRFEPIFLHQEGHWHTPLHIFKAMLPMEFFRRVVIPCTSGALMLQGSRELSEQEFLVYIGIWFAMTFVSVETRHHYWAEPDAHFIPAPNFGRYMKRDRFEVITSSLRFATAVPAADSLGPVRDLISAFNSNMIASFRASWCLVVDESMTMWTNKHTIPNYVFIPRKPTPNGQEWHTLADGITHVIIALDPVEQADNKRFDSYGKMAGTVLRLCEAAGAFETRRVLVGDSAFPTVTLMKALYERKIYSIFAIKKKGSWNKHTNPQKLFDKIKDAQLGEVLAQRRKSPDGTEFYIAGLRDMNPCLVMSNTGTTLQDGTAVTRYTKLPSGVLVQKTFVRPDVFETFYTNRHAVDDNNNLRQNTRSPEEVWQTKEWSHRTFAMLLGICEANAYHIYRYFVNHDVSHYKFRQEFVSSLLSVQEPTEAPRRLLHAKRAFKPTDKVFGTHSNKESKQKYPQKVCINCPKKKTTSYCSCDITKALCADCYNIHFDSL
jgi:hypothetical protein